jgi:hypothetical protein
VCIITVESFCIRSLFLVEQVIHVIYVCFYLLESPQFSLHIL